MAQMPSGVFSGGTGAAYELWRNWQPDEPSEPRRLPGAAILAANPHDSQPWLFRVTDGAMDVYADTRLNIGANSSVAARDDHGSTYGPAKPVRATGSGSYRRAGDLVRNVERRHMSERIGYRSVKAQPSPRRDLQSVSVQS